MAITFIAASTQDQAGANALTFSIPGAAQSGDLLLVAVKQSENTSGREWDNDGGGGRGYIRVAYNRSTGGRDQETAVYYKIHSGTETSPTFTWQEGVIAEPMSGTLLVYRGVDTTAPIENIAYAFDINDANPPNPSVIINNATKVVVVHNATHDDISSPAAPSGYTMRSQIWSGTSNYHRNHFTADSDVGVTGTYTPPDWLHAVLNNTPEYQTYTIAINPLQSISITDWSTKNDYSASNTITGFGFGASKGSGKLELWSDTSGTIKELQTTSAWSDTSVTFSLSQGSLNNNTTIYVVVTSNANEVSSPKAITVGLVSYNEIISNLNPDHHWPLNNNYDEIANGLNMTSLINGTQSFSTDVISEGTTHSWLSQGGKRACANSNAMNNTALTNRLMGGWIQINTVSKPLTCIYEEGGGVNNLAFFLGMGNKLIAQFADTSDDNVQAFSDFALEVGRPYHILFRFSYTDIVKEFTLYIDGVKQQVTSGNPLTATDLDAHSGGITFGGTGGNLEVAGTDVNFVSQINTNFSNWLTFSRSISEAEIYPLFSRGAVPNVTFGVATQASLQASADSFSGALFNNVTALALRLAGVTGGGDVTITFNDIFLPEGVSLFLEWRGIGELTIINKGTSNFRNDKCIVTSNSGSINIIDAPVLSLTGLQTNSEIRIYDSSTGNEIAGIENSSTTFTTFLTNPVVDIVVHNIQYKYLRINNVNLSSNLTLPIQQIFDRNYTNV